MSTDYGYTDPKTWYPHREKDPESIRDYDMSWAEELDGETISTSNWDGDGLTVASNSISGAKVIVTLSGGTKGRQYNCKNTITTSGGQTLVKRLVVKVLER